MSKAVEGAAMLGAAVGMGALAFFNPALIASPLYDKIMESLVIGGIAMEAGAIADALSSNRGTNITTRQPAAFRQVVYGEQRVGGVLIYESTTGGSHSQYNQVIVIASHVCDSLVNIYLDGRQVFFTGSGVGNSTRNGVNFGGNADGNNHTGPNGVQYNFGGLVYVEACYGDQTNQPNTTPGGGYNTGLHANDPTWGPGTAGLPYVGGCTYIYLKVEYDANQFPQRPEVRVTVRGKNDILDPRTGTIGYTNNWALCVADEIQNTSFGLGDIGAVNTAQLIAAANVCDEQVALGQGGTEARYALNWHFDTSMTPGAALDTMMWAAAGRLSYIGGEWYIWPAYWQGPSFTFDANALAEGFTWNPYRPFKDLVNRVTGTYVAPNYPYNATQANGSNYYDTNGFATDGSGTIQDNFGLAFQPTNYPEYACDALHGYAADQYLNEDSGLLGDWAIGTTYNTGDVVASGGQTWKSLEDGNVGNLPATTSTVWVVFAQYLPMEVGQQCVLSLAQAQRVAKIYLLRNRQQGTGSMMFFPVGLQMQPLSVMQFTFPTFGWAGKALEIGNTTIDPMTFKTGFEVNETDPSVYEWSVAEELTIYDDETVASASSWTPAPPTEMSLTSSAATAVQGLDGLVTPRVMVTWDEPLDGLVTQIELQVQGPLATGTTAPAWTAAGSVSAENTTAYVTGVVSGSTYNFRIRALRANGANSTWVEIDGYTVSITISTLGQSASQGMAPGSLIGEAYSNGSASILVQPFTAMAGSVSVACLPAGAYGLNGLTQGQLWYVYYVDPTFAGGAITPIATQSKADFLNKVGYFLIDSLVTPVYVSGGSGGSGVSGARYSPSTFAELGSRTTSNPGAAFDGDTTTAATVSASASSSSSANGCGQWSGFPNIGLTGATLTVSVGAFALSSSGTIEADIEGTVSVSVGGAVTVLADVTSPDAAQTLTFSIPSGTNISTVSVTASATVSVSNGDQVPAPSGFQTVSLPVTEIYIQ